MQMSDAIKSEVIGHLADFETITSTKLDIVYSENNNDNTSNEEWLKECISMLSEVDSKDFSIFKDLYDSVDKLGAYLMY